MAAKKHILVVDDEPSVLITYRLILEQNGYRVTGALTSAEALAALNNDDVDLLLCDLSLEQQESGFDVIDYARRRSKDTRCVLLTGYATAEAADRAEKEDIPVLYKPIDIQQMMDTISSLLKDNHELREATGD